MSSASARRCCTTPPGRSLTTAGRERSRCAGGTRPSGATGRRPPTSRHRPGQGRRDPDRARPLRHRTHATLGATRQDHVRGVLRVTGAYGVPVAGYTRPDHRAGVARIPRAFDHPDETAYIERPDASPLPGDLTDDEPAFQARLLDARLVCAQAARPVRGQTPQAGNGLRHDRRHLRVVEPHGTGQPRPTRRHTQPLPGLGAKPNTAGEGRR
jgi:hypothetical protein